LNARNAAHAERVLAHQSSGITASVRWISVRDEWPDAELTVLVAREGNDIGEPVWLGYTDGETWFDACTGAEFAGRVTHWAELPMGPNP
jgi:uncharacterized protein DUF551